MTTLYALTIGAALLLALISGLVWALVSQAKGRAVAEKEAETNQRMADHAEAQGNIIAEHRDIDDVSRRLRDGTF